MMVMITPKLHCVVSKDKNDIVFKKMGILKLSNFIKGLNLKVKFKFKS